MRIVNLTEFCALPAGTVFMRHYPRHAGFPELEIKQESIIHDQVTPDFFYSNIPDIDAPNSEEWIDSFQSMETGASVPACFDVEQRDGSFDPTAMFIVLDTKDTEALILRLKRAIAQQNGKP